MKELLARINEVVVQVSTPFAIGTGFFLKEDGIVVTSEKLVRRNQEVTIHNSVVPMQLGRVLFLDPVYDIAFIEVRQEETRRSLGYEVDLNCEKGEKVIAAGHPSGMKFIFREGQIIESAYRHNHKQLIRHNIELNAAFIGGPLVSAQGQLIGMNIAVADLDSCAVPVKVIEEDLDSFRKGGGDRGVRCSECAEVWFEEAMVNFRCPSCDAEILLWKGIDAFQPIGVASTIEELLEKLGYSAPLARRGPNAWEIIKGSALISISYHEDSGLINGDAYLCELNDGSREEIFAFLLSLNYELEGLTFSIKEQDVVLSLLIYDQYLNIQTGMKLFEYLFEKADYYDNILVEKYGANWIENEPLNEER